MAENTLLEYYERVVKECLAECDGVCHLYNDGHCNCVDANVLDHLKELKAYRDAEEQGLLLRLPCKVGDAIYKIPSKANYELNNMHHHSELNRVYKQIVYSVEMFSNDRYFIRTCDGIDGVVSDFYKETWFITHEEALFDIFNYQEKSNFCPNCGADMRKGGAE